MSCGGRSIGVQHSADRLWMHSRTPLWPSFRLTSHTYLSQPKHRELLNAGHLHISVLSSGMVYPPVFAWRASFHPLSLNSRVAPWGKVILTAQARSEWSLVHTLTALNISKVTYIRLYQNCLFIHLSPLYEPLERWDHTQNLAHNRQQKENCSLNWMNEYWYFQRLRTPATRYI